MGLSVFVFATLEIRLPCGFGFKEIVLPQPHSCWRNNVIDDNIRLTAKLPIPTSS